MTIVDAREQKAVYAGETTFSTYSTAYARLDIIGDLTRSLSSISVIDGIYSLPIIIIIILQCTDGYNRFVYNSLTVNESY